LPQATASPLGAVVMLYINFANYTATYGSLDAAIGPMTWMWPSAIIVLVGAELNSEIERQAARGATRLNPEVRCFGSGQDAVDVSHVDRRRRVFADGESVWS